MTTAERKAESISLTALAEELLGQARAASSGRAAHTVSGGRGHRLRDTAIALAAGEELAEHSSPGEATLQVLRGRVRLTTPTVSVELAANDFMVIPAERHALAALEEAVVLLTVVTE